MEQKTVKIIGFRAEKHNIVKTIVLTPDIFQNKLIQLVGESGNGKSTLLEMLQTAVAGTDAIKSKNVLEKGYLSEALLLDGDIKIYVGAKVTEYKKGENAGAPKFETFLYAKDNNDKQYTPIIDGAKATAGEYVKLLTTDLTFNMPALFTENQTEHRKLIEKLFKPELDALGADEVVARIVKAKAKRDASRTMCQANGAYMQRFEDEGYTEVMLNAIKQPNITEVEDQIFQKKLEKDRLDNSTDLQYNLKLAEIKASKVKKLQEIKDNGIELKEQLRLKNEARQNAYDAAKKAYDAQLSKDLETVQLFVDASQLIDSVVSDEKRRLAIQELLNQERSDFHNRTRIPEPILEPEDKDLVDKLQKAYADYAALENEPEEVPEVEKIDTSAIEEQIEQLQSKKKAMEEVNDLYTRYQLWKQWIEDSGLYEVEVDTLRKMYAKIDCGVPGMNIVPVATDSDRIEVWVQYNGEYDTEFFHNEEKESRYIFQYSSFQRSAIGVMLQAARLNLKPKALRLAIVDDVAFTQKGLAVLSKLCEDMNVLLITSRTDDYDKDNISQGEIIVEGGEVFFNKG